MELEVIVTATVRFTTDPGAWPPGVYSLEEAARIEGVQAEFDPLGYLVRAYLRKGTEPTYTVKVIHHE